MNTTNTALFLQTCHLSGLVQESGDTFITIYRESEAAMALRDRQISGIPLTKQQSEILSHILTLVVPVLGYKVWYPLLGIPEEMWFWLAVLGVAVHLAMSAEIVPNGVERNLLWFGSYTGSSFSNGICFLPRLPFPVLLILIRIIFSEEFYRKILWSLEGDVPLQSIVVPFTAEGMARGGARVRITGKLRLEVEQAAVFHSQTMKGVQDLIDMVAGEYQATVKSAVIMQHTAEELMYGTHSGGAPELAAWMTDAWNLVVVFGVKLASAPIAAVEILGEQVERAFDRAQAQEIFTAGAVSIAQAYAVFKKELPEGTSEEVALAMFNADRIDSGQAPISINVVKFR